MPARPTYISKPQMSHSQSLTCPPEQANSLTAVFDPLRQPNRPSQPCALPRLPLLLFFWCVFLTTRQSMMPNCSPRPFLTLPQIHHHASPRRKQCCYGVYCLTQQLDEIQTVLASQKGLKGSPQSHCNTAKLGMQQTPAAHTPRCVILLHM